MKLVFVAMLLVALALGAGLLRVDGVMASDSKEMKDMAMDTQPASRTHHAVGVVKKVDVAKGSVTISHGAVKSLNWPAMTMTFGVKDKLLLGRVTEGMKVEVDFVQEGSEYNIVKLK